MELARKKAQAMVSSLVGCVLVPHLAVQLVRQQHGHDRPVAVAAQAGDRAILTDVCPRAAARGVHTGMFAWDARQRCPTLVVARVDPTAIAAAHERVRATLLQHADLVDPHDRRSWLLPMCALGPRLSRAAHEAEQLQQALTRATTLHATVGLSLRPGVAHIAATVAARSGRRALVVLPGAEPAFLAPLPIEHLPGVGPRTRDALARLGITTVGQLAAVPVAVLEGAVGSRGRTLHLQAQGLDRGTASNEAAITASWHVPAAPCADPRQLRAELAAIVEEIGRTLRVEHTAAGTLTITVMWTDRTTTQRTVRVRPRGDLDRELIPLAWDALEALLTARRIAVVGLSAHAGGLGPREPGLFTIDDGRSRQLQQAVDAIKQRWGAHAIGHAALLTRPTPAAAGTR